ncbi:MAG: ABC transporter permease subunit [Clostridia bacterium]
MKKSAEQSAVAAVALNKRGFSYYVQKYWPYYALLAIPVIYVFIFKYIPMYGVQIAFKDYRASDGIWGSEFVGWENFIRFFKIGNATTYIMNTLYLSIYGIIAGFPFPIILALCLNYVRNMFFKKTVQMISYAPHFISMVVMVGILIQFFARNGFINFITGLFGMQAVNYMADPTLFGDIYVWSGVWQNVGFSSILYLGILSNVDYNLHEAAIVDGASIVKRMWYIDFPVILPTAITLLVMSTGQILNVGFEKVYLMQNPLNTSVSEIISTYTYKMSFESTLPDFGYSTAIGLFQSAIGFVLLMVVNKLANKFNDSGIF